MISPAVTASTRRQPDMRTRARRAHSSTRVRLHPGRQANGSRRSARIRGAKDPNEHHRRPGEKKKRGLRPRDPGSLRTRHRSAELYLFGQHRGEQVRQEHGQNGSDDHAHHVTGSQLLPSVLDDQDAHQRDRAACDPANDGRPGEAHLRSYQYPAFLAPPQRRTADEATAP
jgi:hypothetical protein